ncbi:Asparagine synthetase domain-containing protein 1 [Camellia lanceoleosa]|uniref:Asparagine synthetase domain-containing protein 1 n=1 Tax=Camellia lanceoleosa TaxID=1840588 RepID=A0ACC0I9N0_9ERIC|nr:Asparagine synthetase domain-containing protein 1 [Camellia lanceoleosa]
MCGIALIVCGVRIDLSALLPIFSISSLPQAEQPLFSINDIKAALRRRGPDSLGSKKVFLHSKIPSSVEGQDIFSLTVEEEAIKGDLHYNANSCHCISSASEEPCMLDNDFDKPKCVAELFFLGATLQLRGINPIIQPLVDAAGNILVYNGEIFGGIYLSSDSNDGEILMESLGKCCSCSSHGQMEACHGSEKGQNSVPNLLSTINGPWALIYWQASSRTIWFGRDAFGRRSLLVHWPTSKDSRLLLTSVSPPHSIDKSFDHGEEYGTSEMDFWEELPCGVYSMRVGASKLDANMVGEVKRHEWTDPILNELIKWDRTSVQPKPEELNVSRMKFPGWQHDMLSVHSTKVPYESGLTQASVVVPSETVLLALREAVMRRTAISTMFMAAKCGKTQEGHAPVAVLFSGGLDSMILSALLDECLDSKYEIDLLNVSFDKESAPDRISARAGVKELKRISPLRRWKLVEIDADLSKLTSEAKHVTSLINPAKTYVDLNIGLALWLAAGGDGWVCEERIYNSNNNYDNGDYQRIKYKSEARILLVGSGADEQCAGYGRHRTKYRNASWLGLHEEMKLDMQRIWKRNLGRDDRCIADNGKEARFPFLDEDVIRTLLSIPLWEIADLDQPSGKGDKKILREVAQLLGLHEASVLPKRAIQFGSRIARESNRKNFGSNRAANQASAGSVEIYRTSSLN